jgi:FixJ family two-component response regulator
VSEGLSNNEQSVEAATEEMPTELRKADVRVELRPADEGVAEAVVRDLENEEVALRLTLRLRSVDAGVASLMLSSLVSALPSMLPTFSAKESAPAAEER